MKNITENQLVEWKSELNTQKTKKIQAESVLDEINRTILMIEGGIQFAQISLKKHELKGQQLGTVDLGLQSETAQQDS
tara:strand:+ start:713 stop:946 length:234 start_codon:yes stop_codon:yes gene_type:complete